MCIQQKNFTVKYNRIYNKRHRNTLDKKINCNEGNFNGL